MPTKKVQQITAWSYSRWATWSQCGFKAKCKFILRLPEPSGAAAERGNRIGDLADKYVGNKLAKLPEELRLFKVEFQALRRVKALTQLDIAFTKEWDACSPTDWDRAWVRMRMDTVVPPKKGTMHIIDNKTGKVREDDYTPQLELYALGGFLKWPQAEVARTNLWFLDQGVVIGADATEPYEQSGIYTNVELPLLREKWEDRVQPMLTATAFPPRPGNYCRWCHYRKANGGPCKF